jgi:hypothetical protein
MNNTFTPPANIALRDRKKKSIFLAGSIDMGVSEDWQTYVIEYGRGLLSQQVNFFNPRRLDWDNSWVQELENPQFNQQVKWELNALKKADIIIMNFTSGSISPISLLELGRFADSGKMLVCCPKEFWRKGNVDIICEEFDIPLFENLDDLLRQLEQMI